MKLFRTAAPALLLGATMMSVATQSTAAETFKIALGAAQGGGQYVMAERFVEELEKATDGELTADLFPNSQLGSEEDTVMNAAMGMLDFSVLAINNVTPFSPTVGVLTLPYMIQNLEEAYSLTQGKTAERLVENTARDAGVRIVAWTFSGFRVLTNSARPVKTLDDLQGLIIRVPKNEIMIDTYKSWGVNPTPMAWSEVFTALQQKVVDGQDLGLIDLESVKFYEVQKYISNIHYNFLLEPMIMSEQLFQSQSPEFQQAILDAGKKATEYSVEFLREREKTALDELLAKGMEFTEVDEAEWIEKATAAVWPKFHDSVGGIDAINETLEELGRQPIE
ncbi:TRAP transporter substrate-binding protein [Granulosicoccus sp. 3-233]|uniref:TRAP transporter substrate-binding protein n=1 Tax=Granulosicoccus sp. 3-233 TaxID=3417969 RepID=UPI003D342AB3